MMDGNITIILTSRDYIPFDKCHTRSEVSQCFQVEVEIFLVLYSASLVQHLLSTVKSIVSTQYKENAGADRGMNSNM